MEPHAQIGIVGDLHGHWDDWDARYFGTSPYHAIVFVGDLGSGTRHDGVRIARSVGRLAKPALVMPGNNDAAQAPEIAAELGHQRGLSALLGSAAGSPIASLSHASGRVRLCGYSSHLLPCGPQTVTLIAARPHAMGGSELSFPERLQANYGITSMAESEARLCKLVDDATTADLLFLAHNGPLGLGARPADLWGADFTARETDWGDSDLAAAIAYAKLRGKRVRAVIAGHMHRITRAGDERAFQRELAGTLYVNPARVPRITPTPTGMRRHHAVLEIYEHEVRAREAFVDEEL